MIHIVLSLILICLWACFNHKMHIFSINKKYFKVPMKSSILYLPLKINLIFILFLSTFVELLRLKLFKLSLRLLLVEQNQTVPLFTKIILCQIDVYEDFMAVSLASSFISLSSRSSSFASSFNPITSLGNKALMSNCYNKQ